MGLTPPASAGAPRGRQLRRPPVAGSAGARRRAPRRAARWPRRRAGAARRATGRGTRDSSLWRWGRGNHGRAARGGLRDPPRRPGVGLPYPWAHRRSRPRRRAPDLAAPSAPRTSSSSASRPTIGSRSAASAANGTRGAPPSRSSASRTAAASAGGRGRGARRARPAGRRPRVPVAALAADREPIVGASRSWRSCAARSARPRSGRAGVVAIAGDPGIGKSRLVDEAVAESAARGAAVVRGRADEESRAYGRGAPRCARSPPRPAGCRPACSTTCAA